MNECKQVKVVNGVNQVKNVTAAPAAHVDRKHLRHGMQHRIEQQKQRDAASSAFLGCSVLQCWNQFG